MTTKQDGMRSNVAPSESAKMPERQDGVTIGVLLGVDEQGAPLVAFPGNPEETAIKARAATSVTDDDIGREVALLFERGDPRLPLVIGVVQRQAREECKQTPVTANLDGKRILLSAEKEIVLKCGKSSITLTRAGKILIRGAYLLSRSSGANRIQGGSVHVN